MCFCNHGEGVRKNILVFVMRVLLDGERRELGNELCRKTALNQAIQRLFHMIPDHELAELCTDPLCRNNRKPFPHSNDGLEGNGVRGKPEC